MVARNSTQRALQSEANLLHVARAEVARREEAEHALRMWATTAAREEAAKDMWRAEAQSLAAQLRMAQDASSSKGNHESGEGGKPVAEQSKGGRPVLKQKHGVLVVPEQKKDGGNKQTQVCNNQKQGGNTSFYHGNTTIEESQGSKASSDHVDASAEQNQGGTPTLYQGDANANQKKGGKNKRRRAMEQHKRQIKATEQS